MESTSGSKFILCVLYTILINYHIQLTILIIGKYLYVTINVGNGQMCVDIVRSNQNMNNSEMIKGKNEQTQLNNKDDK